MKKQSIILGFSRYNNGVLGVKVRTIIRRMTGNTHFPAPDPTLAAVALQADAYDAALQAIDGSTAKRLLFTQERKAMEAVLKHLGWYVLQHGNDDPVILESSGFDLAKPGGPGTASREGLVIEGYSVEKGMPTGTMRLKCHGVAGARVYMYQYTPTPVTPDSVWTTIKDTRSFRMLEGLTPGVEYAFRMSVIAAGAREATTEHISRFAS